MTDVIGQLASRREAELEQALSAAVDDAIGAFDFTVIAAILANADEDGPDDHDRDQLGMALDLDTDDEQGLSVAFDRNAIAPGLASFFAAVAALAASGVRHVLNDNSADLILARDTAVRSFRGAFIAESALSLRDAAERMLYAIGDPDTRAAQIRRTIGLSALQARSLNVMRQALHTYLANPKRADIGTLMAYSRGNLSAAQHRMLAKALRDGLDRRGAEALLDRHAKALRNARVKAVAGNAVHQLAEAAKLTGWQIAQRLNALPIDQRRHWQTAGDERVRHAHAQVPSMNPAGVPLNQPFATPLGPCFTPPLEHGCRCKAILGRAV